MIDFCDVEYVAKLAQRTEHSISQWKKTIWNSANNEDNAAYIKRKHIICNSAVATFIVTP